MVTKKQNIYIKGKPSLLALLFLLSPYIYIGGGAKLIIYHVPPLDATRFQKCTPRHFLFEEKDGTLFLILKNILNRAKMIEKYQKAPSSFAKQWITGAGRLHRASKP
jgi:hypothetical protein